MTIKGQRYALDRVEDVEQLEDLLSEPTGAAVETMARLEGDLILLGVGGKMGPTLARMARRADEAAGMRRRILGVSRFTDATQRQRLETHGIETVSCDLLDAEQLARLPDAPNVVFMTGMKFGATGNAAFSPLREARGEEFLVRPGCQGRRESGFRNFVAYSRTSNRVPSPQSLIPWPPEPPPALPTHTTRTAAHLLC